MSVQKVEQKFAFQNNKLTLHFAKWEPILKTQSYIRCSRSNKLSGPYLWNGGRTQN